MWYWLKHKLELHPYWAQGHLDLAELGFVVAKESFSYASGCAALLLEPRSGSGLQARLIISRCLIKNMELVAARECLEGLLNKSCSRKIQGVAREYYADSLILEHRYGEAVSMLEAIPEDVRSPSSRVALQYALSKTSSSE